MINRECQLAASLPSAVIKQMAMIYTVFSQEKVVYNETIIQMYTASLNQAHLSSISNGWNEHVCRISDFVIFLQLLAFVNVKPRTAGAYCT